MFTKNECELIVRAVKFYFRDEINYQDRRILELIRRIYEETNKKED